MLFIDREEELGRLEALRSAGGLAVLHGRRRIGKTRLLVEWCDRSGGLYTVSDQSAPEVQRRYFAEEIARRFPGFAEVEYPDWRSLLDRLAREARAREWRGPLVMDEIPYAVAAAPELPSVLQRWLDHEAAEADLVVAIAGSSQRMMQGIVLSVSAPLYGRARELLDLGPLPPHCIAAAFGTSSGRDIVELHSAWGGVPRYWELAAGVPGGPRAQIERLVLDPMGPLHREPDHLLLEEMPPALEVRPLLDAIGAGAHRVSEIAGRIGRPATSLSRPLTRLLDLGIVRREVPFGEPERRTKRSLYRIRDPFFRLWFRAVAPWRSRLAAGTRSDRQALLSRHWSGLVAAGFEDLCRDLIPRAGEGSVPGGPWGPPSRWWHGEAPEWDVVAESADGKRLLLGEVKWRSRPVSARSLARERTRLLAKPGPDLPARYAGHEVVRALFVPDTEQSPSADEEPFVVTAEDLLAGSARRSPSGPDR